MPFHSINYSTFICPSESGKWKRREKLQKCEYLKNKKSFLGEIKAFSIVFEGLSYGKE